MVLILVYTGLVSLLNRFLYRLLVAFKGFIHGNRVSSSVNLEEPTYLFAAKYLAMIISYKNTRCVYVSDFVRRPWNDSSFFSSPPFPSHVFHPWELDEINREFW